MLHAADHGDGDVVQGADKVWQQDAEQGIGPSDQVVRELEIFLAGSCAHKTWAKIVDASEAEPGERIFSSPFDARPHDPSFFCAVSMSAGDIAENHLRIEAGEHAGEMQGDVVGDVGVVGFAHSDGTDAGAEEAGVITGQLIADVVQVHKIADNTFFQFGMLQSVWFAADEEDARDCGMFEAGEQDAFADHSGGAGDDDVEVGGVWTHGCRIAVL